MADVKPNPDMTISPLRAENFGSLGRVPADDPLDDLALSPAERAHGPGDTRESETKSPTVPPSPESRSAVDLNCAGAKE